MANSRLPELDKLDRAKQARLRVLAVAVVDQVGDAHSDLVRAAPQRITDIEHIRTPKPGAATFAVHPNLSDMAHLSQIELQIFSRHIYGDCRGVVHKSAELF